MNAPADIPADQPLEQGFRLDELTIDPRAGEVTGPAGREKLDPKVMDVLVMLAKNAGHVVLRGDLQARLWPNAVVTDASLSRCIYELRRQLSQASGDERYKAMLETVPKRGFRLNARINPPAPPALTPLPVSPAPQGLRGRRASKQITLAIAGAMVLAGSIWLAVSRLSDEPTRASAPRTAAAATNSIAVLPFVDMSAAQDQRYLSDGIADEILNRLTRIPGLRVIARTSSFTFRDQQADVREIASKLDVSHVLEGSVRRAGDQVRITAQLIDASSNSHLWSRTYDRALGDLFAVQDEIAASVATALDLSLSDATHDFPAPNTAAAHQLFLQGEFFFNRRGPGDAERSAKYYEDAVSLEPDYARAWAALSRAYSLLGDGGDIPRSVARVKEGEAAHKAVALAPRVAESHYMLARFYFEGGDRDNAHKHLETAASLDPGADTDFEVSVAGGHLEADVDLHRQMVARDPLSAVNRNNLGVMLVAVGRLEDAKSEFLKAKELSPDNDDFELEIIRVLVLQRRYDEVHAACFRLPEGEARDHGLALLFDAPGRRTEADAALARLVEGRGSDLGRNIRLAEVYAYRRMTEEAVSTLQDYRNAIDPGAETSYSQIYRMQHEMDVSPFLAPLHTDPRWKELMAEPA